MDKYPTAPSVEVCEVHLHIITVKHFRHVLFTLIFLSVPISYGCPLMCHLLQVLVLTVLASVHLCIIYPNNMAKVSKLHKFYQKSANIPAVSVQYVFFAAVSVLRHPLHVV